MTEPKTMITQSEVKHFYEDFTKSHIWEDRLTYNRRYIHIRRIIKRHVKSGMNVLELGCGTGITAEYILKQKARVTGVDLSENNINFARQLIKKGVFIAQDVLTLDLNQTFDVITLFDFMEHIPEEHHHRLFSIIKKHSQENTTVIINIPNARSTAHTRLTQPDLLQIVDEEITIREVDRLCEAHELYIQKYVINNIFKNEDYDEIIIKVKKAVNVNPVYESRIHFIFRKLWWMLRNAWLKKKYLKVYGKIRNKG